MSKKKVVKYGENVATLQQRVTRGTRIHWVFACVSTWYYTVLHLNSNQLFHSQILFLTRYIDANPSYGSLVHVIRNTHVWYGEILWRITGYGAKRLEPSQNQQNITNVGHLCSHHLIDWRRLSRLNDKVFHFSARLGNLTFHTMGYLAFCGYQFFELLLRIQ